MEVDERRRSLRTEVANRRGPSALPCHLPATVAPIGQTPGGLPVGAQIIGPYLEDRTTIEFAGLLGDVIGGFSPPTI